MSIQVASASPWASKPISPSVTATPVVEKSDVRVQTWIVPEKLPPACREMKCTLVCVALSRRATSSSVLPLRSIAMSSNWNDEVLFVCTTGAAKLPPGGRTAVVMSYPDETSVCGCIHDAIAVPSRATTSFGAVASRPAFEMKADGPKKPRALRVAARMR